MVWSLELRGLGSTIKNFMQFLLVLQSSMGSSAECATSHHGSTLVGLKGSVPMLFSFTHFSLEKDTEEVRKDGVVKRDGSVNVYNRVLEICRPHLPPRKCHRGHSRLSRKPCPCHPSPSFGSGLEF